jgi:hypothetical protein
VILIDRQAPPLAQDDTDSEPARAPARRALEKKVEMRQANVIIDSAKPPK